MQRVFVGDVQGCADELAELLARAEAEFGTAWELWVVGDLVNRGPSNLRALRLVRALYDAGRARYVLGNHELGLLLTAAGLREPSPYDSTADVLSAPDAEAWIDWLRRLPLVATGTLGIQRFAMVHAAVHPAWSLEELERRARAVERRLAAGRAEAFRFLATPRAEDPVRDDLDRLVHCRSVGPGGVWFPEPDGTGARPWHEAFVERGHGYGVVYGHWSLQGLHVAPWLRGLDTGCVHHGRGRDGFLTAWVPPPDAARPFDVPDAAFWKIRAHRAYYARRDAPGSP